MLTDLERHAIDKTVELVNAYGLLQKIHPSDDVEFATAIHRIQDMIMSRPVRREYNQAAIVNAMEDGVLRTVTHGNS